MWRALALTAILFMAATTSRAQSTPSTLRTFAFRIVPHEDVKKAIMKFANDNSIKAGCIISAVGSLEQVNIRFANQEAGTRFKGPAEVVSLTGTFSQSSSHIHISVSDENGNTKGGHLLEDNLVFTTLEIVVGELQDYEFVRETDPTYGYDELVVKPLKKNK
jgi:predicted DNA-binding protein with PD1-like motif